LWIDDEKVRVDSRDFARAAADYCASHQIERARTALRLYSGRFSVEFEYEDWAAAPRDRLHAQFLEVVHVAQSDFVAQNRYEEAAELLRATLDIDPDNLDVEQALISVYLAVGARAAATEQWRHYAAAYREQFAAEPPSLRDIDGSGAN
jgi:two-component SAPR family response regulator